MRSGVQVSLSLQKFKALRNRAGLFSFWMLKACFHKDKREKDRCEQSEQKALLL